MAESAKNEIIARSKCFSGLLNADKMDEFLACYTENATMMPPNSAPLVGRKAIGDITRLAVMGDRKRCEYNRTEFFELMSEDTACTNDFWDVYNDKDELIEVYHSFMMWKKLNGEWFIDREISNNRSKEEVSTRKRIQDRIEELFDAFNRDDYDTVGSIYTENATIVPHEGDIQIGRPAIKEAFRKVIPSMQKLVTQELYYFELLNDDTAYSNNHWKSVDDQGKIKVVSRDCLIWKKLDGEWHIHRDFWNDREKQNE